jgi:hypothetical protein
MRPWIGYKAAHPRKADRIPLHPSDRFDIPNDAIIKILSSDDPLRICLILERLSDELSGALDITQVHSSVVRQVLRLAGSPDPQVCDRALDVVSYVTMADDLTLRACCYLQPHQVLLDVVSSSRRPRIVCSALELLKEMVTDKPNVCEVLDGDRFLIAPQFVLAGIARFEFDDDSDRVHLIGAAFDLLGQSLSVFSAPPEMLTDLSLLFLMFIGDFKTIVVHAIYAVSYAQSQLSLELFHGAIPTLLGLSAEHGENQSLVGSCLGILNNFGHFDDRVALEIAAAITVVPNESWQAEAQANFLMLQETLLLALIGADRDSQQYERGIARFEEQAPILRELCVGLATSCDFAIRLLAVSVLCRMIGTAHPPIAEVIMEGTESLMAIVELLECGEVAVIEMCARALLALCEMSPIGKCNIVHVLGEQEYAGIVWELQEMELPVATLEVLEGLQTFLVNHS